MPTCLFNDMIWRSPQGKLEGCQHTDTLFRGRTYRISVFQDGAQASIIINYLVILMCHKVWRYLSALQQVSFQTPRQHIPHCMTTTRYLYELCCRQLYQGTWITRESWEYNNINNTVENGCKNLINLVAFTKHPKQVLSLLFFQCFITSIPKNVSSQGQVLSSVFFRKEMST